jgi:hypothetical protein
MVDNSGMPKKRSNRKKIYSRKQTGKQRVDNEAQL